MAALDESNRAVWNAKLDLNLTSKMVDNTRRTVVKTSKHEGPLRIQRPFYPEAEQVCHLYLLHPPGGMVTGDSLDIHIDVAEHGHSLLTTPSASKIYQADNSSRPQSQRVQLRLANHASVEWLPQETIVFKGARGELITELCLAGESSRAAVWDILCLGRPASDELFEDGYLAQNLVVKKSDKVIYRERNYFSGGDPLLDEAWGMDGFPVTGSLLITANITEQELATLREQLVTVSTEERVAISQVGDLLIGRYLGSSVERCKQHFEQIWSTLRPQVFNQPPIRPRIWNT